MTKGQFFLSILVQFDDHFNFSTFLFHLKKNPFLAVKTGSGQIVVYEVSIGLGGPLGVNWPDWMGLLLSDHRITLQREHGLDEGDILMMMAMTMKTCFVLLHSPAT